MVPGRFKDYISTPKQNDYRSIHTTVIGPGNQRVELQIRTAEMHEIAEYGIAAHALYKDGQAGTADARCCRARSSAYAWLRRTIELLAEGDNPEEFLEHTKLELFQDQVFCFTPKGRLIALPRGATPIDFAYAVHTDVGDTCVGAKINGQIMPLMTELEERRRGRDHHARRRRCAAGRLGIDRRHRQGARRDPPRDARPRCASNMPASAAASSSGSSSAPRSPIRTRSLQARCRGWRAPHIEDVLSAVGRGEMPAADVAARHLSRLQGRARRGHGGEAEAGRRAGSACSKLHVRSSSRCPASAAKRRCRSRSAASTAICRCACARRAAPCRATASSAS